MKTRCGIISAGNWIVDRVKKIHAWPEQGMLANILSESRSTGGAPANVLVDLARLKTGLPLHAAGLVGDDENGRLVLDVLRRERIDASFMQVTRARPTSFCDVMTETKSGARTFFYHSGANGLLDIRHLRSIDVPARIFHLGYLLLLDKLDAPDPEFGVRWVRLLKGLSARGYKISVDVVSEQGGRFKKVVTPVLPYVDYLVLNEIEAGAVSGLRIRDATGRLDFGRLRAAARWLMHKGVRELAVIHFPEGGFALTRAGAACFEPSFRVSPRNIRGTAGAGDAFCAGTLYGIHESWPLRDTLRFANANAAFCLTDPTCTGGAPSLATLRKFLSRAPQNPLPKGFVRKPGV